MSLPEAGLIGAVCYLFLLVLGLVATALIGFRPKGAPIRAIPAVVLLVLLDSKLVKRGVPLLPRDQLRLLSDRLWEVFQSTIALLPQARDGRDGHRR